MACNDSVNCRAGACLSSIGLAKEGRRATVHWGTGPPTSPSTRPFDKLILLASRTSEVEGLGALSPFDRLGAFGLSKRRRPYIRLNLCG